MTGGTEQADSVIDEEYMKTKKVLVCLGQDNGDIQNIRELLKESGMEVVETLAQDVPIQQLKMAVHWADVLVCYLADDALYPEAFELQIQCAIALGKHIIGLWPADASDCPLPFALEKSGDALVDWNSDAIAEAIAGARLWILPHGTPGEPRPLQRHPCK